MLSMPLHFISALVTSCLCLCRLAFAFYFCVGDLMPLPLSFVVAQAEHDSILSQLSQAQAAHVEALRRELKQEHDGALALSEAHNTALQQQHAELKGRYSTVEVGRQVVQ